MHELARGGAVRHGAEQLDRAAQHVEGQRRVRTQQGHELGHVAVEGHLVVGKGGREGASWEGRSEGAWLRGCS